MSDDRSAQAYTADDLAAAWEMGWQSARDNYTALYTGGKIPGSVTLINPFSGDMRTLIKTGVSDD